MQTTFAVLALIGLVAAQTVPDLSQLPQCAQTCTLQGIGQSGCDVTDLACICGSESYLSSVQACITAPGACNEQEVAQAQAFAAQSCPDLNTTSTSSAAPSGSAATTASGAGSTATDSASDASSSASQVSEGATSAASSVVSSATDGASSAASSGPSVATSAAFAAPTLAAIGVAQILGVAAVVGAAL